MPLSRRIAAEFLGTFWLVFGGCATAVLTGNYVAVSVAFGLTVLTMAYAIGHVSGCHLNPAVTIGLVRAGRFDRWEMPAYVFAQVLGAFAAAALLGVIVHDRPAPLTIAGSDGFAANGYGDHSPGKYGLLSALVAEAILTFVFVWVILGSTDRRAPKGFAPLAIGLCLTLIHLISIPITNTSVNPARSIGPAVLVGGWAVEQLWVFCVAPVVGGGLAGWVYVQFFGEAKPEGE